MNQGEVKIGLGRKVAGVLLGILLAMAAPMVLLTEVFSLLAVVLLPSVALVMLYRWAGRGPALFAAILMLSVDYLFLGGALMAVALLATILPPVVLLRMEDRPFFWQLRCAIAAFGVGVVAAVGVLYLSFGGNMIERALNLFPTLLRMQPEETIAPIMELAGQLLQRTLSVEDFYSLYEAMIAQLIPEFKMRLPEMLLSGALISAILCTWISNRMRARRGIAVPGSFVPVHKWALPASTTGGLLLILAVSGVLRFAGMENSETVYLAVYGIAVVAFCAQALGSLARRLRLSPLSERMRRVLLVLTVVLLFMGAEGVMAVYGCASAIFGSRGVLQQRAAQNKDNDDRFGGDQ